MLLTPPADLCAREANLIIHDANRLQKIPYDDFRIRFKGGIFVRSVK
jgi:hypothetical protein